MHRDWHECATCGNTGTILSVRPYPASRDAYTPRRTPCPVCRRDEAENLPFWDAYFTALAS
jgi:hypothetical protein